MGMFEDVLGWLDQRKRAAKLNARDLINNPRQYLGMLDDRAKNYNQNVQPVAQGGSLYNRPMTEEEIQQKYTDLAMDVMPMGVGHIAYHGSPHKFDKFSLDAIGTGEGAQAYGHGLYLAEALAVAKEYQRALGRPDSAQLTKPQDIAAWAHSTGVKGNDDAVRVLEDEIARLQKYDKFDGKKHRLNDYMEALAMVKQNAAPSNGNLYKTDIPDEAVARFLDWDKPLSQQAPEVQAALKRRITDVKPVDGFDMGGNARLRDNSNGQIDPDSFHPWILEATGANGTSKFGLSQKDVDRMFGTKDVMDLTGEQIISRLASERGSQSAASDYLKSINVPGIRYLDGGSRSAGQGSSNFVVFDPEMIRILERNGGATGNQPWKPGEYKLDLRDTTWEPPLFPDTTR